MSNQLNHIAIAVPDLEKAVAFYRDILKMPVSDAVQQSEHGVTTVFVDLGNTKIELLEPLGDNSPIKNFLEKNPNGGIHHICIEKQDIATEITELQKNNIRLLNNGEAKIGAHGKLVVFLHPKDCLGTLIELEQET